MNKESEDYLDQLLNSVQEQPLRQEQPPRRQKQHREETPDNNIKEHGRRPSRSQEDFIREFEQELSGLDENQLISDFELSLDQDLFSGESEENLTEQVFTDEQPGNEADLLEYTDSGSEAWNDESEDMEHPQSGQETSEAEDNFFAGLDAAMNVEDGENEAADSIQAGAAAQESIVDSAVGGLSMEDFPDLFSDAEPLGAEEVMESVQEGQPVISDGLVEGATLNDGIQNDSDTGNADDILSLLDGLGEENEDIADISNMLKADENHETIPADGEITAESVADSLADLGFEVNPEDADELASLKEVPFKAEEPAEDHKKAKKSGEKKGFLEKLKNLFFGPEEEEAASKHATVPEQENLEELTDENLDILKALEGGAAVPDKEDPKVRKKAKKEEKKKAAAAKKEAKSKEREAKKKQKAIAKAAKPKKEKKPKVKDNTPPLPKKPVFLIFLLSASILGGVLFAGKGLHRRLAMSDSENYFSQGEYVKAYGKVAGLKIKDDNKTETQYIEKIQMLAGVQELYDSYQPLVDAGRQELALDCLIRIIGHYDENIEKAGELGCSAELAKYEGLAEDLLKETYHTPFEEALRIYQIRNRVRYSTELVKILKEAGMD